MKNLNQKNILLGVTGGIAAYKIPSLIRLFKKANANVKVIMTDAAKQFVTQLTCETVSGNIVYSDLFSDYRESSTEHISLARWADVIIIAPATANCIAKLSHGLADDLLSTVILASEVPIVIVPGMNTSMWNNAITQENIKSLKTRNFNFLKPEIGMLACGESGCGKMAEPENIIRFINSMFNQGILKEKNILITAGPTQEPLDPVRFISNLSSGKMGFAIAKIAQNKGANVTLVSGPVNLETPSCVKRINARTADEMYNAVMEHIDNIDIFIGVAAVSDYKPDIISKEKIKKTTDTLTINLIKNKDILASISNLSKKPFTVGFALESENMLENAKQKLINKNLDMIVANTPENSNDEIALTIITKDNKIILEKMNKITAANALIEIIAAQNTKANY